MAKSNMSTCRDCGEYILWVITPSGKKMPIDADSAGGRDEFYEPRAGHVSHFGTCRVRNAKPARAPITGTLRYVCPACAVEIETTELLEIPAMCSNCPPGIRGVLQGPFAPTTRKEESDNDS